MSVNVEGDVPVERAWPGADATRIEAACARIARHISRAGARVIGLVPVDGAGDGARDLSPFLERLAAALASFVGGDVVFIGAWARWRGGVREEGAAAPRMREIRPQVIEIAPPPCPDAPAAAIALQQTLASLRKVAPSLGIERVLVDLEGYSGTGSAPAALVLVDGVIALVAARRDRKASVARFLAKVPAAKNLGAILVG